MGLEPINILIGGANHHIRIQLKRFEFGKAGIVRKNSNLELISHQKGKKILDTRIDACGKVIQRLLENPIVNDTSRLIDTDT